MERRLEFRYGRELFVRRILLAGIVGGLVGIPRPFLRPVLYGAGGRQGPLVRRLRRPRRFWQAFGLMATEIVFDVDERTRFLDAFEERRRLLSPVEPERADA